MLLTVGPLSSPPLNTQTHPLKSETFVNAELVRVGHAVMYTVPPNVAHVDDYRKAQTEAREAGRGVWNPAQPLDVMPDCYRKLKKGREC